MKRQPSTITLITLISFFTMMLPSLAKNISVSAQLQNKTIAVGEATVLNVTVKNASNASVQLPDVDGLFIANRGRSSSFQFINGAMSSSLTYRYIVRPNKEGSFTIAPITVQADGKKYTIAQKLTLKVTQGVAPGTPPTRVQPQSHSSNKSSSSTRFNPKDIAHIEVVGLKKNAVVGELIPIEIRAYFKNNRQVSLENITSAPSLQGAAFTLKIDENKPRQGRVTYAGKPYYAIIFKGAITPVKEGEFNLPINLKAIMQIRVPSKRKAHRRRSNDPFSDPFFQDAFDDFFSRVKTVRKEISVTSDPFKIKVTATPDKDKPEGFDGAIGQFQITSSAPTHPIKAGDPLTLTVRVSGKGNLNRLHMPRMLNASGWKTYPPKSHLESEDALDSSGVKVFEQTIVPRNPSVKEIPAMELVYFNPKTKKYETTRTLAIPIKILPGTNITENTASDTTAPNTPPKPKKPKFSVPHSSLGWLRKSRLDQSSSFIATTTGITALLLAISAGLVITRKRNTSERQANIAKKQTIQSDLKKIDNAIAQNDVNRFFKHARHAVQHHWAEKLNMQPDAITSTDLPNGSDAQAILEKSESISFSNETNNPISLTDWKAKLDSALS